MSNESVASGFFYDSNGDIRNLTTGGITYSLEEAIKLAGGRTPFSGFIYGGDGNVTNIDQLGGGSGGSSDVTKAYVDTQDKAVLDNITEDLKEYYNKEEVNKLIEDITTLDFKIVDTLPTEEISTNTIYLVPKETEEEENIYNEYLYVNSKWELIGDTAIDLSGYAKSEELAKVAKSGDYADLINAPTSLPANGGNADTIENRNVEELCRYYDLGSEETDVNTVLITGTYKCINFINYPKECADGQGILKVENYMIGNNAIAEGTMGTDSMWLKQYFTSPHNGKTYERHVNAKNISEWQLVGSGGNADTVDGKHASDFAKANLPTGIPVPLNISGASSKWYRLFCFDPIAGGVVNFSLSGFRPFNIGASFVVSASWNKFNVEVLSCASNVAHVKEIRCGYNVGGDNLHYVDVKLEVTEALVSSGVLFLTIGTDSNVGNKNIDLSKLGSDVDSVTYASTCVKEATSKTLAGTAEATDYNGSASLTNGLYLEWGKVSAKILSETDHTTTVVFKNTFSNIPIVNLTCGHPILSYANAENITKSEFDIYCGTIEDEPIYYFAIGKI